MLPPITRIFATTDKKKKLYFYTQCNYYPFEYLASKTIKFYFLSSEITPIANGLAANGHLGNNPILISYGGPGTMLPSSSEIPLVNGVANGHVTPTQESPFIGYIIAMHRKMVRASILKVIYRIVWVPLKMVGFS